MATTSSPPMSRTQAETRRKSVVVTTPPKFDLETYPQNYSGRTKFERLLLIGRCSQFLAVEALKSAVHEAKKGKDISRYLEAQNALEAISPHEPEAIRDLQWIEQQDRHNQAQTLALEKQLREYKNNLVKESIRMGNEDLGKHYQEIGDLPKAFDSYMRMRTDVSSSKQIVDVSKRLIEVAIEQRNWLAVTTNLQKIKQMQATAEEEKSTNAYVSSAEGLAHMDQGEFYLAALAFLRTTPGMGNSCNKFISPNDLATYGGLCALTTMDRNELNKSVLDNPGFRAYLELEPNIRRAITFFVNSRYTACLEILESYRADYLLDIYLQKHVEHLYHLVRSKSIVQYFIPFSCVTLDTLDHAFAAPGKTIDKELVLMIQRKDFNARINTQNRVLTSVPASSRATLHTSAIQTAKQYEREARHKIQQMNILAAGAEVRGPRNRNNNSGAIDDHFTENASREMRQVGIY